MTADYANEWTYEDSGAGDAPVATPDEVEVLAEEYAPEPPPARPAAETNHRHKTAAVQSPAAQESEYEDYMGQSAY